MLVAINELRSLSKSRGSTISAVPILGVAENPNIDLGSVGPLKIHELFGYLSGDFHVNSSLFVRDERCTQIREHKNYTRPRTRPLQSLANNRNLGLPSFPFEHVDRESPPVFHMQ